MLGGCVRGLAPPPAPEQRAGMETTHRHRPRLRHNFKKTRPQTPDPDPESDHDPESESDLCLRGGAVTWEQVLAWGKR
eukprot:2155869-Rhodomonas_salina.1